MTSAALALQGEAATPLRAKTAVLSVPLPCRPLSSSHSTGWLWTVDARSSQFGFAVPPN